MNKEQLLGVVRHVLTFGGGYLVSNGYINGSTLETITALIITIAGLIWSAKSPEKKV